MSTRSAEPGDPAVRFLLAAPEPAIRHAALGELFERPAEDPEVAAARTAIPDGPIVRALLAKQNADGQFRVRPYQKVDGRALGLVSLSALRVLKAAGRWAVPA